MRNQDFQCMKPSLDSTPRYSATRATNDSSGLACWRAGVVKNCVIIANEMKHINCSICPFSVVRLSSF